VVKFRVELVWQGDGGDATAPSIYLTADGRVILQGSAVSPPSARRSRCRSTPS
jgi:hypothetical protein